MEIFFFLKKKLILTQMRVSTNYSKMDSKMEMSQTHFDPSQNGNGDKKWSNGQSKWSRIRLIQDPKLNLFIFSLLIGQSIL